MEIFIDGLKDAAIDTIKLIPFLLITYIIMEWIEKKTEKKQEDKMQNAGKVGPLFGGCLGVLPQCGFSAAASNFYAGGVITVGTLLAVFMSTSDEMLPIFISETVPALTIIKILAVKALIAIVTGFALDLFIRLINYKEKHHRHIHELCEEDHCDCHEGILKSAVKHTIKITFFIFAFSLIINLIILTIGEDSLKMIFNDIPVLGEAVAALVGLIPNCSASVVITQLYLEGVLDAGAMMSGLLVSAGVGLLVLFRANRHHMKENLKVLGILYMAGLFWGIVINFLGITF